MKKSLFLVAALAAFSVSLFTGCGQKNNTDGNSLTKTTDVVAEESKPEDKSDGNGFEYVPKPLNGRAVTSETGDNALDEEKPDCKKRRKRERRRPEFYGELYIIHFGRDGYDIFKPHFPPEPVLPEKPEEPEEPENGEN